MKKIIKSILGKNYNYLLRIRHSDVSRRISAWFKNRELIDKQKSNKGTFPFEINGAMGIGGSLTHMIRLSVFADRSGLVPLPKIINPLYAIDDNDVFGAYLHCRSGQDLGAVHRHVFRNEWDYFEFISFRSLITLDEAHRSFMQHYVFDQKILAKVTEILPAAGCFPLSIHYRSTDKGAEAQSVSFDVVCAAIDRYMKTIAGEEIFVATDDSTFLVAIKQRYPENHIITFQYDEIISIRGEPRHFSALEPGKKTIEAFVNMNLLARAKVCVRTVSYMSALSKIINPTMPMYTLNQLHKWEIFPEGEIWKERFAGARILGLE